MSNEQEIIKKLLAIAENQQKIIQKLAQSTPTSQNLTGVLQSILDKLTAKNPSYAIMDSLLGDGTLQIKMKVPAGDNKKLNILDSFKSAAATHANIDPNDVKISQVSA